MENLPGAWGCGWEEGGAGKAHPCTLDTISLTGSYSPSQFLSS